MARKPKQSVTVELPSAFIDFMREVHQYIVDGEEVATTLESDDLLQCQCIYGGLYNAAKQQFGFRFFHPDRTTWDFDVNARQIAQIAAGKLTTMPLWQCQGNRCGCLHATEDSYCHHCDSIRHFDNDYEASLKRLYPNESSHTHSVMTLLRKIGMALWDYHREYERFPPWQTLDANGQSLHSWRSLILPFLDEDSLFEAIDFSQPWDSDTNRRAWERRPSVYGGKEFEPLLTNVMAVVGAETIWPPVGRGSFKEIDSKFCYPIGAVALTDMSVHWMQPIDTDVFSVIADHEKNKELIVACVGGGVEILREGDADQLHSLLRFIEQY